MGGALRTDLYELTMAAGYVRRGMAGPATFSLFIRDLPASRGFAVAAGLEDCLDFLEGFSFADDDLTYLETQGFDRLVLDAFARMRFTGDVWAVPEGRIILAGEPLLEVTAPLAEAQLVETFLLNQMTYQTALAAKAARCRLAAGEGMDLVDFAFRRTHGLEAALAVARTTAMVGFTATSNVEAARRYGLTATGTMAHSWIEAFPSEADAFRAFAQDFPDRATFLVDTYDTLEGVRTAIAVIREMGLGPPLGVRIDSGDLAALAAETRRLLDGAGLHEVRIVVSGGLDEFAIEGLRAAGAPVDAAGVGTKVGVSVDAPVLDSVYKLVAVGGRPVLKLSPGKATLPGAKQVFRTARIEDDVLGLRHEPRPPATEPLLVPVMREGRRTAPPDPAPQSIAAARRRFEEDLPRLPPAAVDLHEPRAPRPRVSDALQRLTDEVSAALRRRPPSSSIPKTL